MQTFDNHGYDHWDPMESRETYASMDRHFQSPDFQPQVPNSSFAMLYETVLVKEFTCILLTTHKAMQNSNVLGVMKPLNTKNNYKTR